MLWLRDMTSQVAGGEAISKKNACFSIFLGEKSTKCGQKAVKCLIISHPSEKKNQFSPFPVKFSILVKSKMAAKMVDTFDDVTGTPAALHPIIYTSSCRAHHRLSTKGKNFAKYCNITKTQGMGFHQPYPRLYSGVSMSLLVHSNW